MVYILIDPTYLQSVWCINLKQSLTTELKKKRIHFTLCENYHSVPSDTCVFLIASDHIWTENVIRSLNQKTIQPILICNQIHLPDGLNYSCVCSDVYDTMKNLFSLLNYYKKNSPAIYGINPQSMSDISILKCAENVSCEAGLSPQYFYNHASLSECFEAFYKKAFHFDSVLCVNDFAAVSLIKHMESRNSALLNNLMIFSCAKSEISELYPQIISLRNHYTDYGKAAVYISEKTNKNTFISNMTIRIARPVNKEAEVSPRELTLADYTEPQTCKDDFYQDPEIHEMICLEKLLCSCDKTDFTIIDMLRKKATYNEICEKCFLCESSVSYRVNQIIKLCGFQSKEAMLNIVEKYC